MKVESRDLLFKICHNVPTFAFFATLVLQPSHLQGEDSDGSTQVPSASSSPLDSAFESRAPSPVRPGAGAKVSWADLAEEARSGESM